MRLGLPVVIKTPPAGHRAVPRTDYCWRKRQCHELFDAASSGLQISHPR